MKSVNGRELERAYDAWSRLEGDLPTLDFFCFENSYDIFVVSG